MSEKAKAILGYFIWIVALVFLLQNDTEHKTKIHNAQAITIAMASFAVAIIISILNSIISAITGIGLLGLLTYPVYIACFVFEIMGIVKAANDEDPELPLIGNIAKSIFGKMIGE